MPLAWDRPETGLAIGPASNYAPAVSPVGWGFFFRPVQKMTLRMMYGPNYDEGVKGNQPSLTT
jgi:hypothetical protein